MKSLLKVLFFSFLLIGSSLALADNVKEGNRLYNAGRYEEAMRYYLKPDFRNFRTPERHRAGHFSAFAGGRRLSGPAGAAASVRSVGSR